MKIRWELYVYRISPCLRWPFLRMRHKMHLSALAFKYCKGKGIEIGGGAHNTFLLNTRNVDFDDPSARLYKQAEIDLCGEALPVDIVIRTPDSLPLPDESEDFIISSHVLEHCPNPVETLLEWGRVVKPGGILFMILPHKERTFEKDKSRTPFTHMIQDWHDQTKEDQKAPHQHYHVWITEDVVNLVRWMIGNLNLHWEVVDVQDPDDKVGNGFTIVIRKSGVPGHRGCSLCMGKQRQTDAADVLMSSQFLGLSGNEPLCDLISLIAR